jgi:nucleoside-diphosphate-sugar epimerase
MCKILITGAFGFVGSNLSSYLSANKKNVLLAVDLLNNSKHLYSAFYPWSEINNIDWNGLDTIIHLAGIAHDTKNTYDANKYFEINVGLTKQIFNCFLNSGAKKFIYFSSVKAVADSIDVETLTEDYRPDPHTPYGKSKLEAERCILSKTIPEWKKVYIMRPCMIHGPGNKGNLNLLYKFVKLGIPYPLGAFKNKRSFSSIENLNFIIEQIIEGDINAGIYQIADNEALSTNEIVSQIATALGKKVRIWKVNKQFIKQMAKLGDQFHLPFNSERLRKLTENYVVSNHKLIEALGKPLPISSKEGLLHTVRSFSINPQQ